MFPNIFEGKTNEELLNAFEELTVAIDRCTTDITLILEMQKDAYTELLKRLQHYQK